MTSCDEETAPSAAATDNDFEYIVIGTGLTESIIAASLARKGWSVLQIDEKPYYGSNQASLNLVELQEWSTTADQQVYTGISLRYPRAGSDTLPDELRKASRKYSLSLCPCLVPAICPFVDTLVASGVAKYTNFNLLHGQAIYRDGELRPVASAKADIFNDNTISLIDKRKLMKFLTFAAGDFESNSVYTKNADLTFEDFLSSKFGLSGALRDTILYAAALSTSTVGKTASALLRLRKYIRAAGRFGRSSFLLPEYGGIGELIQGFCRLCAVHGGVNMLGRHIHHVEASSDNKKASVRIEGDEVFTASRIIRMSLNTAKPRYIARAIAILDKPVQYQSSGATMQQGPDEDSAEPEKMEHVVYIFPPGSIAGSGHMQPVQVLQTGPGTFSTPAGHYAIYLWTEAGSTSCNAEEVLRPFLDVLLEAGKPDERVEPLMELFYTENVAASLEVLGGGASDAPQSARNDTEELDAAAFASVCDDAVDYASAVVLKLTGEAILFDALPPVEGADDDN